jgi:hypothetical protein
MVKSFENSKTLTANGDLLDTLMPLGRRRKLNVQWVILRLCPTFYLNYICVKVALYLIFMKTRKKTYAFCSFVRFSY